MKATIILRGASSLAILGAIVCLFMLTACGNGAGDKVDSKGAEAKAAAGNEGSAIPANSASRTTSNATTTDKAMQPGTTQTRNNGNQGVSSIPKPQIGTGGSDFFLFTQARSALSADAELKAANIMIDVKAGVLTLSGTVANAAQKSKAEQMVRSLGGVKAVKNQLRVSGG